MKPFSPRLDILPPAQAALWAELGETPPEFTLYGGTAIALQLGHRQSVDFDFFTTETFDPAALLKHTRFLRDAVVVKSLPDTLTVRVDRGGPVALSFFSLPRMTLKALMYFEDGNVSELDAKTRRRLIAAAKSVDLQCLPDLEFIRRYDEKGDA
jgi:hypothetical protein